MGQPSIDDSVDEIREREQQKSTTDGGGQGSGVSVPSVGLSRKQLLILGLAAAVAVAVVYARTRDSSPDDPTERAEIEHDDGGQNEMPVIPNDPDDPLAGDRTVIQHFKDEGIITGGE